jgi:myo-inositol-1(or 4)-monophosphatase
MAEDNPEDLLALAVELATRAGALIRAGRERVGDRGDLVVSAKSTPTDVVTEQDRASEAFLVGELRRRRPGDAILGEEGGSYQESGWYERDPGRVRWLVDPIDGTVNYLYGIPQYAVSVAAELRGAVVAGAVHNPVSGETFRASAGGGAWLAAPGRDDRRLAVTGCAELPLALVGTGFSYDAADRAVQARIAAALLPRVRDIRRFGAASLDLCYLAAGRVDAYYEHRLSPWDYAAGGLVAAQAGALTTGLYGRTPGPHLYAAAGQGLAAEFFALLESLGAGRQ